MQLVTIHIPNQDQRGKALLELVRRGRVLCLPHEVFVVPEPAIELLRSLQVSFDEVGREDAEWRSP